MKARQPIAKTELSGAQGAFARVAIGRNAGNPLRVRRAIASIAILCIAFWYQDLRQGDALVSLWKRKRGAWGVT